MFGSKFSLISKVIATVCVTVLLFTLQSVDTSESLKIDEIQSRGANSTELDGPLSQLELETQLPSPPPVLFHLLHTNDESFIGLVQKRCLDSIFFHHPNAEVRLHVLNMSSTPFQHLIDSGYNLKIETYDIHSMLLALLDSKVIENVDGLKHIIEHIDEYRETNKGGSWIVVEADILRLLFMYFDGGFYLGKSNMFSSTFHDQGLW
jgi:hypothetical protein